MTESDLVKWIQELIAEDKLYKFYKSRQWLELRTRVLEEHHYECVKCRARGKITKAQTVHHINHVKDKPGLALSEHYTDESGNKKRNLVPLCNACHNAEHPEKQYKAYFTNKKKKNNEPEERWD